MPVERPVALALAVSAVLLALDLAYALVTGRWMPFVVVAVLCAGGFVLASLEAALRVRSARGRDGRRRIAEP